MKKCYRSSLISLLSEWNKLQDEDPSQDVNKSTTGIDKVNNFKKLIKSN